MCDNAAFDSAAAEFLANARAGECTTFGSPQDDVTKGYSWGCERTVPASAIEQAVDEGCRVCLIGARVTGNVTLTHVDASAGIELDRCYLDGGVRVDWGAVDYLVLSNTCLEALSGEHLETAHSLKVHNVDCRGALSLGSARVGGDLSIVDTTAQRLDCARASADSVELKGCSLQSISAEHVATTRWLKLYPRECTGAVSLRSAKIGGDLRISGTFGEGLDCDRVNVLRDVEIKKATIHARPESKNGSERGGCPRVAFSASRMQVGGSLRFTDQLDLGGAVYLHQCQVQENLEVDGATLSANGHDPGLDLFVAKGARVNQEFLWRPRRAARGPDLSDAQVRLLRMPGDEAEDWPTDIDLRGLRYEYFSPAQDEQAVANWLRRVSRERGFYAQTYERMAAVYRAQGQTASARTVLIAKQHSRREQTNSWQRAFLSAHWALAGYGYRPAGLLAWLVVLSGVGTLVFWDQGSLVALDEGNGVTYYPFLYALDTTLPVVDLGQQGYWMPADLGRLSFYWLCIIAGWVFAAVGASGLGEHLAKRRA